MGANLQNPINTGFRLQYSPSKPYQYWVYGFCRNPSKPYQYWARELFLSFKTLSILGVLQLLILQNPINTGTHRPHFPSKPYQYWVQHPSPHPSKPYQYWVFRCPVVLQNPINTGITLYRVPSKPYQYWVLRILQ